jgi:NAD(P) transhydrogenase
LGTFFGTFQTVSNPIYDVVVIGTGPGGEGAAMKAVKAGKSVAVVESYMEVGGGATHWGTIPSKALRQLVQQLRDCRSNPVFKRAARGTVRYPELLEATQPIVGEQVSMRRAFYDRNGVTIIGGTAKFVGPNELEISESHGAHENVQGKAFVIATGTRPFRPADIDFSHPRVLDSDKVLSLPETPRTLTIYGAGVIGCEYASIFRNLDVKINLVNTRDKLLTFLDDEIIDALAYHLRDQGVLIRHDEMYEKVEPLDDGVVLHLKSGKQLHTDYLLWANGRAGNVQGLGLEKLGIEVDKRGYIKVNENYQTKVPNIYAVGDVVGLPSLASASYDQGRYAATHIVEGHCDVQLVRNIPTGIFTIPEISSIGQTERELTEKKVPYEVGHALFRHLARAQIVGKEVGMLKLLFHRETLELLGVHCFGDQASEIIHIGQAIITQKAPANTLMYFINTTFNYPTMAEAYRVAALNGLNRLKD